MVPCFGGPFDGRQIPVDPDMMRNRCFDAPEPTLHSARFRLRLEDAAAIIRRVRYYIHVAHERHDKDHNGNDLKMWNYFLRRYEPYFLTYYWYLATPEREPSNYHLNQSSRLAHPFLIERRWKQGSLLF